MRIRIHELNSFLSLTRKPCAKVLHLHLGRFQCRHCTFTANLKKSINGHYKANHPDSLRNEDSGLVHFLNETKILVSILHPAPSIKANLAYYLCTLFKDASSAAQLIPLCRKMPWLNLTL
jgi:hypothetical protein